MISKDNNAFPKLAIVHQEVDGHSIENVPGTIVEQIQKVGINGMDLAGKTVGITAGSRGIDRFPQIIGTLCDQVKSWGATPVIIPAMGSHGGGTEKGRLEVLRGLGVTEAAMDARIKACAVSDQIGLTPEGYSIYCNRVALGVDHLILVNRIKRHTDYSGIIESGLHKIMTIGLGGPTGATHVHMRASEDGYEKVILSVAREMLEALPVLFAMGIVENGKNLVARIEAIIPENLYAREAELLQYAKEVDTRLPLDRLHVLVVGEIGKDVSGGGMEGPVVGRIRMLGQKEPQRPAINRIVVLSLTPASHGNASGLGLADITTRRVFDAVDMPKTALNCLVSMGPEHAAIPCTLPTDREAISAAIRTSGQSDPARVRLAYIQNTKKLNYLAVSESLLQEICHLPGVQKISDPVPMHFDEEGNLLNFRYAVK